MMFSSRELFRIPDDPVVSSLELVLLLRRLVLLWDLLCCDDLDESCRMDEDLVAVVVAVEFSPRNCEMSAAALSLLFSGQALCSGPALRGRLSSSSSCDLTRTTASSG